MATKKVTEWNESQSMHFYTSLKEGTTLEDYAKNNNRTLANVQKKCTTVTKQELRENRSVEDIHKTYGIPLDIINELHKDKADKEAAKAAAKEAKKNAKASSGKTAAKNKQQSDVNVLLAAVSAKLEALEVRVNALESK